jgi:RNA polymerase sigma-70 factor (ECF subfamily)
MSGPRSQQLEPPNDVGDDILVRRAQQDPRQFDPIFERYWNPIVRYCFYRLGDWHQAEDAAAQVFLNAISALPDFSNPQHDNSFKAWLFTIASRVVSNQRRSETRHPQASLDAVGERASSVSSLEEQAIAQDEHRLLYDLISQLKPEQQQLIDLRLAGLNDVEIARVLDRNPAAVRKALSRAVMTLRDLRSVGRLPREETAQ